MYPSFIIVNNAYPQHLGEEFIEVFKEDVIDVRMEAKKKRKLPNITDQEREDYNTISDGLKLAANSAYGNSNNEYSWMYDPYVTMKTTLNNQLLLSKYIEMLHEAIPDLQMIQANTDGITYIIDRDQLDIVDETARKWEELSGLFLEDAYYDLMVIRNVNNYLAVDTDGNAKYKGLFEIDKAVGSEPAVHKNNSYRIIPIALSEYFINNIPVEQTIKNHDNIYDFCAGVRAKGKDWYFEYTKVINGEIESQKLSKTIRYFISNEGGIIYKCNVDGRKEYTEAHPLKGIYWKQTLFNTYYDSNDYDINYQYYIRECNKVIDIIKWNKNNLF